MRSPVHNLSSMLVLATMLAAALPAVAQESVGPKSPPADGASCRAPEPGDPAPAGPRADLAPLRARLGEEASQARAADVQPLNSRGYNYDAGRSDPAAIDFEARGR